MLRWGIHMTQGPEQNRNNDKVRQMQLMAGQTIGMWANYKTCLVNQNLEVKVWAMWKYCNLVIISVQERRTTTKTTISTKDTMIFQCVWKLILKNKVKYWNLFWLSILKANLTFPWLLPFLMSNAQLEPNTQGRFPALGSISEAAPGRVPALPGQMQWCQMEELITGAAGRANVPHPTVFRQPVGPSSFLFFSLFSWLILLINIFAFELHQLKKSFANCIQCESCKVLW